MSAFLLLNEIPNAMVRMSESDFANYQARHAKPSDKPDDAETKESNLHAKIMDECKRRGWIAFHGSMAHKAMRTLGEPDFTILADNCRVFFIECKSATGKLTPEQLGLKMKMEQLGHVLDVVRSFKEFLRVITPSSLTFEGDYAQAFLPPTSETEP